MSEIIRHAGRILGYVSVGFIIRVLVSAHFKEILRARVEITTPMNDWRRAHEAVFLWNSGLDPYAGNIFHEYPMSLQFYKFIISYFNVDLVLAATDVATAILLQISAFHQHSTDNHCQEKARDISFKVLKAYLFSPITIVSCAGASTSTFSNFLIAIVTCSLPVETFRAFTCVLCALLACNNIHYSTLILPIFLCQEYCSYRRRSGAKRAEADLKPYYQGHDFYSSLATSASICFATLVILMSLSYIIMGNSWSFVGSTYIYALKVQDLAPNIGMLWYFFTEMFEQFLEFFTWIMQINSFIHVIPLSVLLRDTPFFALYVILFTSTLFQPYPALSSIGLITSLLPQWAELFPHMKRMLILCCSAISCVSLWPIFWYLWIDLGTANSNFYFGATLAFTATLVVFLLDLLNSHIHLTTKRRYSVEQLNQMGVDKATIQ